MSQHASFWMNTKGTELSSNAYSGLLDHLCRQSLTSSPKSSGLYHVDY